MLKTLRNAFKIKDVRNRILFTFMMLIVIRIGSELPIPGVKGSVFQSWLNSKSADGLGFVDAITGGSFSQMSVFALNITPYITSSIIMQLLTIAIPKLEEMQRDGEDGRKKIVEITRYLTIALGLLESVMMVIGFYRQNYLTEKTPLTVIMVVTSLTAGSAVLMWIGERITGCRKRNINSIDNQYYFTYSRGFKYTLVTVHCFSSEHSKGDCCRSYHSSNNCCNGSICSIASGCTAQDSCTVLKQNKRQQADGRSADMHSTKGKYQWSYPGNLCTVSYADTCYHCQLPWKRQWKWNRL